jgi:NAD(P)-dependent dehydrogenase (short-subunit alcohol dehydrogenase family)
MKLDLTGMRALVTGASRGVGYGVAELFAASGAQVVATARSEDRLDQLARSVRDAGGAIETIVGDLSTREGAREIARRCGDVDILVNNAAYITPKQQTIITEDDAVWDMEFAVNLNAPVALMQALVPAMVERKRGVVINISTVAARKINPMDSGYSAAKAGLEAATKAAAISLGSHGVRVNAIALGLTDTEVWDDTLLQGITIGDLAKMAVPIERPTAVSEVAALCLFLASDAAPAITGSVIMLDGGMTAGAFTPRSTFAR